MHSVGAGAGLGHSINVPWNTTAERQTPGDAEYLYAFERVLLPVSQHDQADCGCALSKIGGTTAWRCVGVL